MAAARCIIVQLENDVAEAKDVLLGAKIMQAFFANKTCSNEEVYLIGDCVMLATLHHHHNFKAGDQSRVAKFFPQ
jgi:hypothetical protein